MSLILAKELKLTKDHKAFCDAYILSNNVVHAYMSVYNCKLSSAKVNAYKLFKFDKIQSYIKQKMIEKDENVAKEDELLAYLTEILRDKNTSTGDRLKAIDMIGKRYGYNLPKDKEEAIVIDFMGGDE